MRNAIPFIVALFLIAGCDKEEPKEDAKAAGTEKAEEKAEAAPEKKEEAKAEGTEGAAKEAPAAEKPEEKK